jgi:hypothetical protein
VIERSNPGEGGRDGFLVGDIDVLRRDGCASALKFDPDQFSPRACCENRKIGACCV